MQFKKTCLYAFDYVDAPKFYSSEEIETKLMPVYERLKLPQGRLELQTGIKSRGVWPAGTRPSSIAAEAGKKLLAKHKIKPDQIDLLIHASVCRDFLEPATASNVHRLLGLSPKTQIFDLSNACLGVLNGMVVAASMIEAGIIRSALVVTGENSGPLLDQTFHFLNTNQELTRKSIKPFIANLTIGSAGVAFLITSTDFLNGPHKFTCASVLTDSMANELCQGSGNTESLMMQTESEELLHAGIKLAKENFDHFLKTSGLNRNTIQKVLTHQVGIAHRDLLYQNLDLDLTKDFSTFETYGNTGSAALPLTLCKANETNFLKTGDNVALMGIGSGLSSIMVGVTW